MRVHSRNRPVRYEVRAILTNLRVDLLTAIDRWRVTGRIRDAGGWRTRQPWELPENNLADWRVLIREIEHMRQTLDDLATIAEGNIARFLCRTCGRDIPGDEVRAGYTTCEHCSRKATA